MAVSLIGRNQTAAHNLTFECEDNVCLSVTPSIDAGQTHDLNFESGLLSDFAHRGNIRQLIHLYSAAGKIPQVEIATV